MAVYMATRIIAGAQDYEFVVERRPDLKEGIDAELTSLGYEHLIV